MGAAERLELGFELPNLGFGAAGGERTFQAVAARLDGADVDSAWVMDHVFGTACLEPLSALAYAAATTDRVRLGTAVLVGGLRNPVHLAQATAAVDRLSGGRLTLGLALGANRDDYPAFGLPGERRAERFAEGVALLQRLWTEPVISFHGRFFAVEDAVLEPKPAQRPRPPIWLGGHVPAALERAVTLGDGFIGAGSSSPERFRSELEAVRELLARAGRDHEGFTVAKRVYLAIDDDSARARDRLQEHLDAIYRGACAAEDVAVYGSVGACLQHLAELVELGVGCLILNPLFDEVRHLELVSSELSPALRALAG